MHAVKSYQKFRGQQYVEALLHCSEKKVCTNLANVMNVSHDSIYRNFKKPIRQTDGTLEELKNIALQHLNNDDIHLIFDDTQITKIYAKQIEGLEVGFDGSLRKPAQGIRMVTALLTDRRVNIPIDAIPYFSQALAQNHYKTKSEIAIDITMRIIQSFKIRRILGDAHYATQQTITFEPEAISVFDENTTQ
jgi:SRSO17 transposase